MLQAEVSDVDDDADDDQPPASTRPPRAARRAPRPARCVRLARGRRAAVRAAALPSSPGRTPSSTLMPPSRHAPRPRPACRRARRVAGQQAGREQHVPAVDGDPRPLRAPPSRRRGRPAAGRGRRRSGAGVVPQHAAAADHAAPTSRSGRGDAAGRVRAAVAAGRDAAPRARPAECPAPGSGGQASRVGGGARDVLGQPGQLGVAGQQPLGRRGGHDAGARQTAGRGRPRRCARAAAARPTSACGRARPRLGREHRVDVGRRAADVDHQDVAGAGPPAVGEQLDAGEHGVRRRGAHQRGERRRPRESPLPPITCRRNTSRIAARAGPGSSTPICGSTLPVRRRAAARRASSASAVGRGRRRCPRARPARAAGRAEPRARCARSTSALPPSVPPTSRTTSGRAARSASTPSSSIGPACTWTTWPPAVSADPVTGLGGDRALVADDREPQAAARARAGQHVGRRAPAAQLGPRGRRRRRPGRRVPMRRRVARRWPAACRRPRRRAPPW